MTTATWQQIKEVLNEALERPHDARARFLDEACVGNPALQTEVESLLEAYGEGSAFFEAGATGGGLGARLSTEAEATEAEATEAEATEAEGDQIGSYRLLRLLDRGGMGRVYLAERADDQFDHEVAIKVVRHELDVDAGFTRRFLEERQILASLQHPGIAQLYDGGLTEEGRPYLVMEYVDGKPIDVYCRHERLPLDERLRLFMRVAEVVHYAHQNLVVHRDLKPSNILVGESGQVKLLDFGIAKLLDRETNPVSSTHDGRLLVTPGYASPEQLTRTGVTTAPDVYALGVVLYELLSDCRLHSFDECSMSEVRRVILEETVEAPSRAAEQVAARAAEQVAARAAPSSKEEERSACVWPASRTLREDLDSITLKALHKETEHRYGSAKALKEDVRRYLRGLPVFARPATWRYRTAKFARRHRWGMAASAGLLLLLLAYAATVTFQSRRIAAERDRAEATTDFLVDLFKVTDSEKNDPNAVTARELLDRSAQRVQTELQRQPETQALLMNTLGRIYRQLGFYGRSGRLLSKALSTRKRVFEPRHVRVAESLREMGRLRYAQGRYTAARPLFEQALSIRRDRLGLVHAEVAQSLDDLGWLFHSTGDYIRAESLFTEALRQRRRLFGKSHRDVAQSLNNLGAVFRAQGRYQAAETKYRAALAMYRDVLGAKHLRVTKTLNNLAAVLRDRGQYAAAQPYARRALAKYRELFGDTHPLVATSLSNLAAVLQGRGRPADAERRYRQALAMRRERLGERHPHVANSLNNVAAVLQEQGRYEQAEPLAREALGIYRERLGEKHKLVAQALNNLAWLKRNQRDLAGTEPLFRNVLAMQKKLYGPEHPQVAKSMCYLASLLQQTGQSQEARRLFQQAQDIVEATLSEDHPYHALVLSGLGALYLDQGQLERARPLLRRALRIRRDAFSEDHWQTAQTQSLLGAVLAGQGHAAAAAPLLRAGYRTLEQKRGPDDWNTRQARARLRTLPDSMLAKGDRSPQSQPQEEGRE